MAKKEFKVGEEFQFGIIKLKAVESNGYCTGCFLADLCAHSRRCKEVVGNCNYMIFVKVEN